MFREHFLDHREPRARLKAESRNKSAAGIEKWIGFGGGRERIMLAVIPPHPLAKRPIAPRAPALLDPGMLVRRDRLRRELSAEPVRFFGKNHPPSQRARP